MNRLRNSLCMVLWLLTGCTRQSATVLGIVPRAEPARIAFVKTLPGGAPVVVRGKMIQKCPVAGCWFIVRDSTGAIKVDTKSAGFVVSKVPLQTEVLVSGTLRANDAEPVIEAIGLGY